MSSLPDRVVIITSPLYCSLLALLPPSINPIKMPETTTRFKKVSIIMNIIRKVVALLDPLFCLKARNQPTLIILNALVHLFFILILIFVCHYFFSFIETQNDLYHTICPSESKNNFFTYLFPVLFNDSYKTRITDLFDEIRRNSDNILFL